MTSLAAKLALFDQLQSPVYLLDEVEPSLDYVNHKRMQELLKGFGYEKTVDHDHPFAEHHSSWRTPCTGCELAGMGRHL